MTTLLKDQKQLETHLEKAQIKRDELIKTATGLRPETLDIDLIEEYTIQMLGHHKQSSIMIMDDT